MEVLFENEANEDDGEGTNRFVTFRHKREEEEVETDKLTRIKTIMT